MNRRRDKPDGLPFRVYQRFGVRLYSIGYKSADGKWLFRYCCQVIDAKAIAELRNKAIAQVSPLSQGVPMDGGTTELIDAWFKWQLALPHSNTSRRAESTLKENAREAVNLKKAFGHMLPDEITMTDGYSYLDACVEAARPEKGNKEVALLQVILEYGVRIGRLTKNPLAGIRKNKTRTVKRYVTDDDLVLAVDVGLTKGGTRAIVALALKTAYLCVRRSVEVRAIMRDSITDAGIVWHDGKNKDKPPILIEWSDELRATIDAALSVTRNHVAGTLFIFGNMRGQKYTKGGWKAVLDDLMRDCELEAEARGVKFTRFNLQNCRPKGTSDKMTAKHTDVMDATGHTSTRMIAKHYDVRQLKTAKPTK